MKALCRLSLAAACASLVLSACGTQPANAPADAACAYPCGKSCCARTQVCDFESETCSDKCVPNCLRRSCGSDGCGDVCGHCTAGTVCDEAAGQCVAAPTDAGATADAQADVPDAAAATADGGAEPDASASPDTGTTAPDAGTAGPDASGPPPCDPFAQTGCAADQKCTLVDFNGPGFGCAAAGTLGDKEACTKDSECEAGFVCVDFGAGLSCHGLCSDALGKACPASDEMCWGVTKVGQKPPFICLPLTHCDPLAQDCADPKQGCYPLSGGADAQWACFAAGAKTDGQSCVNSNDCIEGFVCHARTCAQLCDAKGGAPACATGTCQTWTDAAGYCL